MGVLNKFYKKTKIIFDKKIIYPLSNTSTILLYHRVADVNDDPHLLCVCKKNFYNQLKLVKKKYNVISMQDLVGSIERKKIVNNSIVITFDDGYADNYYNALPILEELNIPATIYITTDMLGSDKPFYWDSETNPRDRGRALTHDELLKMSQSSMIEIGDHTRNHLRLSRLNNEEQRNEILESKKKLVKSIKKTIAGFSYPFGGKEDYNNFTIEIIKEAGYEYACANFPGKVTAFVNIYELPRLIVRNMEVNEFEKILK